MDKANLAIARGKELMEEKNADRSRQV